MQNDFSTFTSPKTIEDFYRTSHLPGIEIRLLIGHALSISRTEVITQHQRALTSAEINTITNLMQQRQQGMPIAYLLGEREFYGLSLAVTADVLIPRPETELLVDLALKLASLKANILELGTGSGAIAIALSHTRTDLQITATDISTAALTIAQQNATTHGCQIHWLQSDWYSSIPPTKYDLIISNPPYIANHDPHLLEGDLRFEPLLALTDQANGLTAIDTIISQAKNHLVSGGWLLLEHGYDQQIAVKTLFTQYCFSSITQWQDLAGIVRVSGGQLR